MRDDIEPALRKFLAKAATDPGPIRAHFGRLGQAVESTQTIKRVTRAMSVTQIHLNDRGRQVGRYVDPASTDLRAALGDVAGFAGRIAVLVSAVAKEDLAVRPQLVADDPPTAKPPSISVVVCSVDVLSSRPSGRCTPGCWSAINSGSCEYPTPAACARGTTGGTLPERGTC